MVDKNWTPIELYEAEQSLGAYVRPINQIQSIKNSLKIQLTF